MMKRAGAIQCQSRMERKDPRASSLNQKPTKAQRKAFRRMAIQEAMDEPHLVGSAPSQERLAKWAGHRYHPGLLLGSVILALLGLIGPGALALVGWWPGAEPAFWLIVSSAGVAGLIAVWSFTEPTVPPGVGPSKYRRLRQNRALVGGLFVVGAIIALYVLGWSRYGSPRFAVVIFGTPFLFGMSLGYLLSAITTRVRFCSSCQRWGTFRRGQGVWACSVCGSVQGTSVS